MPPLPPFVAQALYSVVSKTLTLAPNTRRYPTFVDSLRDLDDALSLLTLFANLPSNDRIPTALISNCARLCAEWQLYVMRTRSLRKVFLSIKGVYFQAEVRGQTITWLVPYMFTQHVSRRIYEP